MLADAHTGYVSGFEIYAGKKGDTVEKGLGASVVKTLCQPIECRYSCYLSAILRYLWMQHISCSTPWGIPVQPRITHFEELKYTHECYVVTPYGSSI